MEGVCMWSTKPTSHPEDVQWGLPHPDCAESGGLQAPNGLAHIEMLQVVVVGGGKVGGKPRDQHPPLQKADIAGRAKRSRIYRENQHGQVVLLVALPTPKQGTAHAWGNSHTQLFYW